MCVGKRTEVLEREGVRGGGGAVRDLGRVPAARPAPWWGKGPGPSLRQAAEGVGRAAGGTLRAATNCMKKGEDLDLED